MAHRVLPICAETVRSSAAKLNPVKVTSPPALVGWLTRLANVKSGLSNEKLPVLVPVTEARVKRTPAFSPYPSGLVQTTDVSVLHTVVLHTDEPSRAVPDRSETPKFMPKIETDAVVSCRGALIAAVKLMTGAS